MDRNAITLQSYNQHVAEFIAGTPNDMIGDTKTWIDSLLGLVSRTATILELGSGFGRDAAYISAQGHMVQCTDGASAFVEHLRLEGHAAQLLNILTDDFGADRDLIIANAVFEHIPRSSLPVVLMKAIKALRPTGYLGFSIREGKGGHWTNDKLGAPRYFWYWEAANLRIVLEAVGFEEVSLVSSVGFLGVPRLYVIARKAYASD